MAWLSGYGSGAGHRKKYTIDHTVVPASTITGFAKRVVVTFSTSDCDSSGDSLRVTASDGTTLLDFGIASVTSSGGTLTFELLVYLTVNNSTDVDIYVYCKTSGSNGENKAGAVGSSTLYYSPLEADANDWSSNGLNATAVGSPSYAAAQVGNGISLNGSTQYADTAGVQGPQTACSVNAVIKWTSATTALIAAQYNSAQAYLQFAVLSDGTLFGRIQGPGSDAIYITRTSNAGAISLNTLTDVAMTWDGGTSPTNIKLYVNGSQVDTTSGSSGSFSGPNTSSIALRIGGQEAFGLPTALFSGIIDDLFYDTVERSAAFLSYRYTNRFNYSSTGTLGTLETESAPTGVLSVIGGGVGSGAYLIGA